MTATTLPRPTLVAGSIAALLLSLALAGPTLALSTTATAELVGVRTGATYLPPERSLVRAFGCGECPLAVPTNEWTKLVVRGFGTAGEWGYLRVEYREEGGAAMRSFRVLVPLPMRPLLIPAPRDGEAAIHVRVEGSHAAERLVATFPVMGSTPLDPREIRIAATSGWTRYAIAGEGTDERLFLLFAAPTESPSPSPDGMVFDYSTVDPSGEEWGAAGYRLGHRAPALATRVGIPPGVDLTTTQIPLDGSYVAWGYSGVERPTVGELVYGATTDLEGDEVLLFSLNGSFTLRPLAAGPLSSVAAETTRGVRANTAAGAAQVAATVEARASLEDASFVVAQAWGGSVGAGVAKIRHGTRALSEPIDNLDSPLVELSHGDCSGEWRASLEGTTGSGPAPMDAAIMWARGYTPSPLFARLWGTDNGWCS